MLVLVSAYNVSLQVSVDSPSMSLGDQTRVMEGCLEKKRGSPCFRVTSLFEMTWFQFPFKSPGRWTGWSPDWDGWTGSPGPIQGHTSGWVWCGERLVVVPAEWEEVLRSLFLTTPTRGRLLDGKEFWVGCGCFFLVGVGGKEKTSGHVHQGRFSLDDEHHPFTYVCMWLAPIRTWVTSELRPSVMGTWTGVG